MTESGMDVFRCPHSWLTVFIQYPSILDGHREEMDCLSDLICIARREKPSRKLTQLLVELDQSLMVHVSGISRRRQILKYPGYILELGLPHRLRILQTNVPPSQRSCRLLLLF